MLEAATRRERRASSRSGDSGHRQGDGRTSQAQPGDDRGGRRGAHPRQDRLRGIGIRIAVAAKGEPRAAARPVQTEHAVDQGPAGCRVPDPVLPVGPGGQLPAAWSPPCRSPCITYRDYLPASAGSVASHKRSASVVPVLRALSRSIAGHAVAPSGVAAVAETGGLRAASTDTRCQWRCRCRLAAVRHGPSFHDTRAASRLSAGRALGPERVWLGWSDPRW